MNICPLILKYLNEQTDFWKTQYNIEYDKRKKIENEKIKKKKKKKPKKKNNLN